MSYTDDSRFYTVYIPSFLNLEELVEKRPVPNAPFQKNPKKSADRLAYFIGQVGTKVKHSGNGELKVNLHSTYLQDVHKNYKAYLNYAIEEGILVVNDSYCWECKETFTMSYWFSEDYADPDELKPYFIRDLSFVKTIIKKKRNEVEIKGTIAKYPYLYKWIDQITYNEKEIDQILTDHYGNDIKSKQIQKSKLWRLENKDLWNFKTCRAGRLFTPITSIKKEVRRALRFNGESLKEIDLNSSVFFFSLAFLDQKFAESNNCIRNRLKDANPTYFNNHTIDDFYNTDNPCEGKFEKHVLSGELYERVKRLWNEAFDKDYSLKEAKIRFIAILNYPEQFEAKEMDILKKEYPYEIELFRKLNTGFRRTKNGAGHLERRAGDMTCPFSRFTHGLESSFMLDDVCKTLSVEYPECPLYTVHDAILTTAKYLKVVKTILKQKSLEVFGKEVSFKVK